MTLSEQTIIMNPAGRRRSAGEVPAAQALGAALRPPPGTAPQRSHRPVLVVGALPATVIRPILAAADLAELPATNVASAREASRFLEKERPGAIILDLAGGHTEDTCLHFRYDPSLANVPIIGLAGTLSDIAFEEFFCWGGDDLIPRGAVEPAARRLRTLASAGEIPLVRRNARAVVAGDDRRFRVLTARVLRNAGYDVTFAIDTAGAIRASLEPDVDLVVSMSSLEVGTGETTPARAREAGAKAAWVVASPPGRMTELRARLESVESAAVSDASGPPEQVLFVANRLRRNEGPEVRASARLLFGTTTRFRVAGREHDEVGYTYNVSSAGLFVRTLSPPPRGTEVWLEMRPPRTDRCVRLEGRVAWTRGFGSNEAAITPPGFAVQITGGSLSDLARFERGYLAFAQPILAGAGATSAVGAGLTAADFLPGAALGAPRPRPTV